MVVGGGGGVRGGGKDGEACNFSNCLQKPSCRVGVGWGGSEMDNNATLSSAKSLSVRTSVAIEGDRGYMHIAQQVFL